MKRTTSLLQKADSLVVRFGTWLPDKLYLRLRFRLRMGYSVNLKEPRTYSEKLQWLKLYDHQDLYTTLVDKFQVKSYVSNLIGNQYLTKTYGEWSSPSEIDFSLLPNSFVFKTTHGGGNEGVIVVKDKSVINEESLRNRLKKALHQDLYKHSREWPYKNVRRRIIAEEYLEDKENGELRDYKFFCFNGVVKALFVATDRQKREEPFFNFFDTNYREIDLTQGHPRALIPPQKPKLFEEMLSVAATLSYGIPHVRIDLYEANGRVYFGEYTFYHFGGMVPFVPPEWDEVFGSWLELPHRR